MVKLSELVAEAMSCWQVRRAAEDTAETAVKMRAAKNVAVVRIVSN